MPLHRTLLPRLPGQPLARTLAETLTRVLVLGAALAGSAAALAQPATLPAAQVARGVIVQLRPTAASVRESTQAQRERLATVASDAGLDAAQTPMPVGAQAHLLRFAAPLTGTALDDALRRVRLNPQVASAEPDVRMHRLAEPNDPYYSSGVQWHLRTPADGGPAAINLPPAWALSTGLPSQVVAVVDSGALFDHPDMAGKWLPGYDLVSDVATANDGNGRDADAADPGDWVSSADAATAQFAGCTVEPSSWHGTFIAGEIAAASNNGTGVAGVNWNAKILPVRVSGKCGAWLSDVVDGIRWAAGVSVSGVPANPNPAKVINVSFGGSSSCTSSYQSAIDDATAAGSLVVVAAGNENGPLTRPADCRGVLAVGAVRQDGLKTYYSSYGSNVGIMAPGGPGADAGPRLYSVSNAGTLGPGQNTYDAKDGTSFAAPLAAGLASLMQAVNPSLTPAEIVARIQQSARGFPSNAAYPTCSNSKPVSGACNCTRETCGPGLLDADGALQLASSPAVSIVPVDQVSAGSTVTLDGSASTGVGGSSIVGWSWTLVSGTPVSIQSADKAVASVTLPAAGTWVFRLLVTDSGGRAADNTVTVTAVASEGSGGSSSGSSGGGATGWAWGLGLWAVALAAWVRRRRRGV